MTGYNFESHNFRGLFIRHANFEGELTRKKGPMKDFAFTLANRGQGNVAFKSVNFPDRYLRHRDFRIHLDAPAGPADQLFRQDSTFTPVRGLADERGFSYRSFNFPDRYLRHRDFHLWVEPPVGPDDELFRKDATFYRSSAPVIVD